MKEIWKSIKGYECVYEVSNMGNVRSVDRVISGKHYKGKPKSTHIDKNGYKKVALCRNMKTISAYVHRLVAIAFIPNPENKEEIDHINTIKHDSRASNLRWVTHTENVNNPISKKRIYIESHKKESLEKSQMTRLLNKRKTARRKVYQFTTSGDLIKSYKGIQYAAKSVGASASGISAACKCKRGRKSVAGFLWSYTDKCGAYKPYESKCKRLAQCDIDGNIIKIWSSLKQATEELHINNISRAAKEDSKKPISGGFRWKYID